MRQLLKKAFNVLPNIPFLDYYSGGRGTIFMLHRVEKKDINGLQNVENLKISPEYLEKVINQLIKWGYDFISLENIEERLSSKNKKRFVVFTLDDGYKDNFTNAYPIFKKYNIPFTIYVTSSFPNKTANLWWYEIAELILREQVIVTSEKIKIFARTKKEKEDAFRILKSKILTFNHNNLEEDIMKFLPKYSFNFKKMCDYLCMSWDELKKLAKDPLVTIGGHTVTHPALNKLSEKEVIQEIMDNKLELEEKLSIQVNLFSYPFGGKDVIGEREFNIVKKLGFKNATTTRIGNIFDIHKKYLWSLPRIALTENYDLKKKMYLNPLLINKGKRIIIE